MPRFVKASYNESTRTVEYIADNGDRLLRRGGTIAWRFNNPGNLRPGSKYTLHIGQGKTASGPFLIFPTPEAGRTEKKSLLLRKYEEESISSMLYVYAPPQENDTERYIQSVCKKTGFSRDQIIGKLSDDELGKLMTAMEEHEGYHHKADTREERWVRTTSVAFSDGARPLADLPVKVMRNGTQTILKTDTYGHLRPFLHMHAGEVVDLWVQNMQQEWVKLEALTLGAISKAHMFICDRLDIRATTGLHNASTADVKKSYSFRYVVQPGDTLAGIAAKFKISIDKIQKDNGIKNPNRIMASQVLVISKDDDAKENSTEHVSPPSTSLQKVQLNTSTITARPARSKEGTGAPLAIIPSHQKRAPWMQIAIDEAKRWAGKKETEIEKAINYHRHTGQTWFKSMSGDTNAWCASFVNYCLMQAGYQMSKQKARAKSFSEDINFIEVKKPIFGAIALFGRKGGGHVAFVYGKEKGGEKVVVLGGNQGDMITFIARGPKTNLIGYYVPLAYKNFAEQELEKELTNHQAADLNKSLGIPLDKSGREA